VIVHLFIVRILPSTLIHKTKIVGVMSTIGLPNAKPLIKMIEWNLSICVFTHWQLWQWPKEVGACC
jgi:hypothetical protein